MDMEKIRLSKMDNNATQMPPWQHSLCDLSCWFDHFTECSKYHHPTKWSSRQDHPIQISLICLNVLPSCITDSKYLSRLHFLLGLMIYPEKCNWAGSSINFQDSSRIFHSWSRIDCVDSHDNLYGTSHYGSQDYAHSSWAKEKDMQELRKSGHIAVSKAGF